MNSRMVNKVDVYSLAVDNFHMAIVTSTRTRLSNGQE